LRYGRIPFEQPGVLQLYESIKNDDVDLSSAEDEHFRDLMHRLLEKDPSKRINMLELRVCLRGDNDSTAAYNLIAASLGDERR